MSELLLEIFFVMLILIPICGGTALLAFISQVAIDMARGAGEGEVENSFTRTFATLCGAMIAASVLWTLWPGLIEAGRLFSLLFWGGLFTGAMKLSYRMEWPRAAIAALPATLSVWVIVSMVGDWY